MSPAAQPPTGRAIQTAGGEPTPSHPSSPPRGPAAERTNPHERPRTFAIVGAGLAGAKAAEALRVEGFDGRIVLFGAESHRPYERPPLSKAYLHDSAGREALFVHPQAWYAEHDVDLRLGSPVTEIDRRAHKLVTGDGDREGYDKLLLTTGASPRRLPVPGADLAGVHYLRSLDDSDRLRAALRPGTRVVVIGAGWIGLEATAAARSTEAEVTVLERASLPLLRILGPGMARMFADLHLEHGVDLRCGVTVDSIRPATADPSAAGAVLLGDGSEIAADVIIVGIGAAPNVEPARSCGLNVDNGILVNRHLRTSDNDVLAAGDVANAYHPLLRRQLRIEHWANALHQPAVAARTMLDQPATYDRLPTTSRTSTTSAWSTPATPTPRSKSAITNCRTVSRTAASSPISTLDVFAPRTSVSSSPMVNALGPSTSCTSAETLTCSPGWLL